MKRLEVRAPTDNNLLVHCEHLDAVDGSIIHRDVFHDLFLSINGRFISPPPEENPVRLDTGVSPWFYRLNTFMTGGINPASVWVIYIKKNDYVFPFATGEILCEDKTCEAPVPIRVAAGGNVTVKVSNAIQIVKKTGLRNRTWEQFSEEFLPPLIIPAVKSVLAERIAVTPVSGLQQSLSTLSTSLQGRLRPAFDQIGVTLLGTALQTVSPKPEDFLQLQELARLRAQNAVALLGDKQRVQQIYSGNARERALMDSLLAAASKPGGNAGDMFTLACIPSLLQYGRQLGDSLHPRGAQRVCPACRASLPDGALYCPHCGRRFTSP